MAGGNIQTARNGHTPPAFARPAGAGESAPPPAPALPFHRPIADEEPLAVNAGAFVAAAHALTSWALNAGAGRVCIYARAERLPRGGVGERARQLHAQGLVRMLSQRRIDGERLFDYRVERTALAWRDAAPVPDDKGLQPDARLLLDLLAEIADRGERCPADRDLAALLGFRREQTAQKYMGVLRSRHLIVTDLVGDAQVRVVTIADTGARTWSPETAA